MSFHIQLMSTCWLLSPAVDTVMMEVHSLSCLDSQLSSLLCVCLRMCVRHCTLSLSVARKLKPEPARHRGEGQRTLVELEEFCTYTEADSTDVSHKKVKNMFKSNGIVSPNQKKKCFQNKSIKGLLRFFFIDTFHDNYTRHVPTHTSPVQPP